MLSKMARFPNEPFKVHLPLENYYFSVRYTENQCTIKYSVSVMFECSANCILGSEFNLAFILIVKLCSSLFRNFNS